MRRLAIDPGIGLAVFAGSVLIRRFRAVALVKIGLEGDSLDPTEFEMVLPPEALRPYLRRYIHAKHPFDGPIKVRPKPTGYTYFSYFFGHSTQDRFVIDRRTIVRESPWYLAGQI